MPTNDILTPLQAKVLELFFATEVGRQFFLTGGTALAAFYLHHRFSEDLDLFTVDDGVLELATAVLEAISRQVGGSLSKRLIVTSLKQLSLEAEGEVVRIDLVRDHKIQFGENQLFGNVIVDSLENVGASKLTAILSRTESKDFVDLYFILQQGQDLDHLLSLAKQKDLGLTEFWVANMMRQIRGATRMPRMIKPLDLELLKKFYLDLADELLRRVKPAE